MRSRSALRSKSVTPSHSTSTAHASVAIACALAFRLLPQPFSPFRQGVFVVRRPGPVHEVPVHYGVSAHGASEESVAVRVLERQLLALFIQWMYLSGEPQAVGPSPVTRAGATGLALVSVPVPVPFLAPGHFPLCSLSSYYHNFSAHAAQWATP